MITIVGLGFIGASLGLALRRRRQGVQIIGHDRNSSRAREAQRMGAVDRTEWNLLRACEGADVVLLALPPDELQDTLVALGDDLKPGCLVSDTATVKRAVLDWAEESLPAEVAFVGGDPVIQSPGRGIEAARPDLFEGRLYCLTPAVNAPAAGVDRAAELVQSLGAHPYFMDADEHDGLRAAGEHLPLLLTALLLGELARAPGEAELSRLGGQSLAQARALLDHEPGTLRALSMANAQAIGHWSRVMRGALQEVEALLEAGDGEALEALFQSALQSGRVPASASPSQPSLWRQWLGLANKVEEDK